MMRIFVAGPYTAKQETCEGCDHRGAHNDGLGLWPCYKFRIDLPMPTGPPHRDCTEPDVERRDANVAAADEAGREIARRGHTPYIPQKMTYDWERDEVLTYEDFMRVDHEWLRLCDAILYLGPSPGADRELELAKAMGLVVFDSIDGVPVCGS